MTPRKIIVLAVGFGAVLAFAAAALAAADFAGTWNGKTEVPDSGIDELVLVLVKTEAGWSGTVNDSIGIIAKDTPLADIKVDGDKITFTFPIVDGNIIDNRLTIAGDRMTGEWVHPEGDSGTLEFERKK